MKYVMKAGMLYTEGKMSAQIKGSFNGPEKKIYLADGTLVLRTEIRHLEAVQGMEGDIRFKEYLILDADGTECVLAKPDERKEANIKDAGCPVNRTPWVDHAQLVFQNEEYVLCMQSSQSYTLAEKNGNAVVEILHRGLTGGWNIEADNRFSPEMICGIFAFCRYMEQENEYFVV